MVTGLAQACRGCRVRSVLGGQTRAETLVRHRYRLLWVTDLTYLPNRSGWSTRPERLSLSTTHAPR